MYDNPLNERSRFWQRFGAYTAFAMIVLVIFTLVQRACQPRENASPPQPQQPRIIPLNTTDSKGFTVVWGTLQESYKTVIRVERWFPETQQVELTNRSPYAISIESLEIVYYDTEGKILGRVSQSGLYLQEYTTELCKVYLERHPAYELCAKISISIANAKPSLSVNWDFYTTNLTNGRRVIGVVIYEQPYDEQEIRQMYRRAKRIQD